MEQELQPDRHRETHFANTSGCHPRVTYGWNRSSPNPWIIKIIGESDVTCCLLRSMPLCAEHDESGRIKKQHNNSFASGMFACVWWSKSRHDSGRTDNSRSAYVPQRSKHSSEVGSCFHQRDFEFLPSCTCVPMRTVEKKKK